MGGLDTKSLVVGIIVGYLLIPMVLGAVARRRHGSSGS